MDISGRLKDAFRRRSSQAALDAAREWFEDNVERLNQLAGNEHLRRYIFEPFNELLDSFGETTEGQVKATITQVALANAVLAGLPGKLGVGVAVSMGLEAWMAYRIASHVGLRIEKPGDIFKYFGIAVGVVGFILFGFVHLLRGFFSLLSALPVDIPATVGAELLATNFFGVLVWLVFEAVQRGSALDKRLLVRLLPEAFGKTRTLFTYQGQALKQTLSLDNIRLVGGRLREFLFGQKSIPTPARRRGEIFVSAAVAALLQGRVDELDGPLGEVFLQAVRDRWADLGPDASPGEIAEFMQRQAYSHEQLDGVVNVIKGKMFEHLVAVYENVDGDEWAARLHDDESFPGSDVTLTNLVSGQEIEVSLKATADPALIENALVRYPDIPIVTTSEMADRFADDDRVSPSDWSNEELDRIARENLDSLAAEAADRFDAVAGLAVGTGGLRVVLLWPIIASYLRGQSDYAALKSRLRAELGDAGMVLARRLALGAALGPVYVWYLLARGVMELTPTVCEDESRVLRLEYLGNPRGAGQKDDLSGLPH